MDRRRFMQVAGAAALSARRARAAGPGSSPHVVIVGGGFGGGACALELRRLSPNTRITLIDVDDPYVTCPLSNAVVTGLRTMSSITTRRPGLERAAVRVLRDRVVAADPSRRQVRLQNGGALSYDRLVLSPGIRLLFGSPEGYDETAAQRMPHAWLAGPQTRLLAAQLRAVPDGGTVAISVPAGLMRCPPGPYERASLIAHWLSLHRPRSKLLVFDANNHFPRQDVFTAAWQEHYPGRIEWIPPGQGGAITRVDAASGTLYGAGGAQRVAVANVIPPQAPAALAVAAGLATGHGWCPTQPGSFESQLVPGIHVIGDACIAGAMPKSASAARSQALQCAAAITTTFSGHEIGAAELSSVCYSMLGPESAFAIRARFEIAAGDIRQLAADASQTEELTPSPQHAAEVSSWYAEMRSACFGG